MNHSVVRDNSSENNKQVGRRSWSTRVNIQDCSYQISRCTEGAEVIHLWDLIPGTARQLTAKPNNTDGDKVTKEMRKMISEEKERERVLTSFFSLKQREKAEEYKYTNCDKQNLHKQLSGQ